MGASLSLRCTDCVARTRGDPADTAPSQAPAVGRCTDDGSRTLLHCNAGHKLEEEYEDCRGGKVVSGAFGVVRMVQSKKTQVVCALKSIPKVRADLPMLQREVEINLAVDHPNIVRLYNVFEDKHHVYMVMEVCKGGELLDAIIKRSQMTEREAVLVGRQMIWAVNYLHAKSVCHRDLKLENLLLKEKGVDLSSSTIKLIDFGLASRFTPGHASMKTLVGSAYYVAPEILAVKARGGTSTYTEKVDVWSEGVVMYMLLCGSPPFAGKTEKEILARVKGGNPPHYSEPPWSVMSLQARKLVEGMLTRDVQSRVTASHCVELVKEVPLSNSPYGLDMGPSPTRVSKGFFEQLRCFKVRSQFEKAARHLVARHVDEGALQGLRAQFQQMDANGDGMVSLEEAKASFLAAGIQDMSQIEEFFKEADTDGSNKIDYTEFLAATMNQAVVNEGHAWEAFRVFDRDGDGFIGSRDLKAALGRDSSDSEGDGRIPVKSPGSSPSFAQGRREQRSESIQDMLDDADVNGDGKVDFKEFLAMVTSTPRDLSNGPPLNQLGKGLMEFHKRETTTKL